MKNSNDSLKEKAINQEKAMDKKELESISGGGYPDWYGSYYMSPYCNGRNNAYVIECEQCVEVCPNKAIYWESNTVHMPSIKYRYCNNCGSCESACPRGLIKWTSISRWERSGY